ncbi:hypothetical protein GCM10009527_049150 [Actinomadura nitritigenes]
MPQLRSSTQAARSPIAASGRSIERLTPSAEQAVEGFGVGDARVGAGDGPPDGAPDAGAGGTPDAAPDRVPHAPAASTAATAPAATANRRKSPESPFTAPSSQMISGRPAPPQDRHDIPTFRPHRARERRPARPGAGGAGAGPA